jgi:RimJ/RimL family protein N-acetyltransferase
VARQLEPLNVLPARLKAYLLERSRPPYPSDGCVELGRFRPDDANAIIAADRDAEHARWFDSPPGWALSREQAVAAAAPWPEEWRRQRHFRFAVRSVGDGTLFGGCEVQRRDAGRASLAYWTYPGHRGRGYATRAVALATRFCFQELPVRRVQILADAENAASRAVALRAGFAEEGTLRGFGLLRGARRDMVLFSRLDADS